MLTVDGDVPGRLIFHVCGEVIANALRFAMMAKL